MKDALHDCEKVISEIMDKVDDILTENNISFIHTNKSEIIVENKGKEDVLNLINNINDVDENTIKLLLQVTESSNNVFIRQKFN
jgi:hypothetical protein